MGSFEFDSPEKWENRRTKKRGTKTKTDSEKKKERNQLGNSQAETKTTSTTIKTTKAVVAAEEGAGTVDTDARGGGGHGKATSVSSGGAVIPSSESGGVENAAFYGAAVKEVKKSEMNSAPSGGKMANHSTNKYSQFRHNWSVSHAIFICVQIKFFQLCDVCC